MTLRKCRGPLGLPCHRDRQAPKLPTGLARSWWKRKDSYRRKLASLDLDLRNCHQFVKVQEYSNFTNTVSWKPAEGGSRSRFHGITVNCVPPLLKACINSQELLIISISTFRLMQNARLPCSCLRASSSTPHPSPKTIGRPT